MANKFLFGFLLFAFFYDKVIAIGCISFHAFTCQNFDQGGGRGGGENTIGCSWGVNKSMTKQKVRHNEFHF